MPQYIQNRNPDIARNRNTGERQSLVHLRGCCRDAQRAEEEERSHWALVGEHDNLCAAVRSDEASADSDVNGRAPYPPLSCYSCKNGYCAER